MIKQTTLKHRAKYVVDKEVLTCMPAHINSGIIFHDYKKSQYIKVDYSKLTKQYNQIFFNHEVELKHYNIITAALYLCGINNALIRADYKKWMKIDLQELRFTLESAGKIVQSSPVKTIPIPRIESIQNGKTYANIGPYKGIKITITNDDSGAERKILHEFDSNLHSLPHTFAHINNHTHYLYDKHMQSNILIILSDLYASGIINAHLQTTLNDNNTYLQLIKSIVNQQSAREHNLKHVI